MNRPLTRYRFPQVRSACPSSTRQVNNSWSLTEQRKFFFFHSSDHKQASGAQEESWSSCLVATSPWEWISPGNTFSQHTSRSYVEPTVKAPLGRGRNTFSWETESVQDKTAQVVWEIKKKIKKCCSHRQLSAKHGDSESKNCTLYQTLQGSWINEV